MSLLLGDETFLRDVPMQVRPSLAVPAPRVERPLPPEPSWVRGLPVERSWAGEQQPRWVAGPGPTAQVAEPPALAAVAGDKAPTRRSAAGRLGDVALTLAAVLGLTVLGVTVTAHATGLRPLVVKSGSMEPMIPTGAMVLVRTIPAAQIEVGDVVAVDRPDGTRVTHRVVELERQGPTAQLVLKGDANDDVDPLPITVSEVGLLVTSVPTVGRVSAWFASAQGGFALGCVVTACLLPVLRRREPTP